LQEQARQTNSVPNTTFHPGASTGTATVTAAAVIVDPDLADAADATPAQTAQAIEELRLKQRVLRAQARLMALKVVAWGIATVIGGLWETITIVGALLTVMPPTSPLSVPQAWGIGLACVPTLAWCGEQGILPLFDPKRASRLTLGQRLAVMVVVILSVAIACVRGELVLGHNFSDYAVFVISSVAVPGIALAAKRFINGAFWNAGEYQRFKDLLLQCQLMLATLQAQAYGQHRVQQATEQQQALTQSQQAQAKREQEQNQQRREQQLRQMNLEIQRKHRQLEALVRSVVNELLRDPDIKKTLKAVCWDIAEPQQTALTASSSSNGNFLHDPASSMPGAVNPSGASAWPSGRGNARQNNPLMLGMPGNKNGTSNHP
ncbi:MAG: hypothetical protein JOZ57_03575, partial [Abitibacteriaceae bacterium]|nr:hypothetical protein [Abditibacteriaceae bacterium]